MFRRKTKKNKTMARKLIVESDPKSFISEQFRTIRTNIKFSMPDKELKTIVITSAGAGEGKSTISANIAAVFSQEGKKVLLVDGDMRKPTAHYTFGLKNAIGLSSLLTRQCELGDAVQETEYPGLFVITSGPIPPNPAELLASKQMEAMINSLKDEFDFVFFDAPPVLSVTDAQILSNRCDATILVVSSGETQKESIVKAKELLDMSKANIIGVVMNNAKMEKGYYYYYYGTSE
ncbi:CpsD/CapB family tyrosine-protein kinase [Ureibacillus terrenus]|uniref:non-specific protein-tyrosine kinase n=1 Tax=Ureibacillus terrenus TaxID=118246 RepID=A0A540V6W1_9BACL|nr:CpsD/CapB family tyrosine-protein kinase [Ureibacillus terrenus]MED3660473.1 CpsD/CapB family tyrosine-protein kinase [Ureibacillus terrenus]TQE92492.1 CpsD/CapB family tyrosine-protein kinase [Ureibacillus terrenus]